MLPSTKCTHCHPIFWKQQKQHPMFLFFFSVPSSSMRRLLKGKRGINMPFPFRGARRAFGVGASKSGTNVLLRTSETPKLRTKHTNSSRNFFFSWRKGFQRRTTPFFVSSVLLDVVSLTPFNKKCCTLLYCPKQIK